MHGVPAAPRPTLTAEAASTEYPVRFSGTGSEYFRIWIVNLLLTIVTVGIYSAWAKVRRLKYMYRNTQIDNTSFDYHGSPIAILKGRLIALVLLLAYNFSFQFSLVAGVITLVILAAIFPWLMRQSLRFRARYSSYRGIHFQFLGGLAEIYAIAAPVILVVVPIALLGYYADPEEEPPILLLAFFGVAMLAYLILLPYLHYRFKRYQHGHTLLGSTAARFYATAGHFYAIYGILLAVLVGLGVVFGLLMFGASAGLLAGGLDVSAFGIGIILFVIAVYGVYLVLFAAFVVLIQNRVWNHTTIGEVGFRSNARIGAMSRIYLVNILLLIVTLGLYTPFAVIRSAKYRLESVTAFTATGMDKFLGSASDGDVAATGEGAADLFDFDLGL